MTEKQIQKLLKTAPRSVNGFVKKFCGPRIGKGTYRDVYIFKRDDRYVVKIEREPKHGSFTNVTEWRYWMDNREYKQFSKWLAPCIAINETGQILIQKRVNRHIDFVEAGEKCPGFPDRLPAFFTDRKRFNFGWMEDGRFVCCDYAFVIINVSLKMRKVYWR